MKCPKCGSNTVFSQPVTETTSNGKTKGFGAIKACLGFLLVGPFGILCGLCGMGKGKNKTKTTTKVIHTCQECGKTF